MATTAILPSQGCLLRPNNSFHYEANPNPQSKVPRHRKRSPAGRNQGPDRTASVARFRAKNLVMGEVKILKRGEELRPPTDLVAGPTDRLGPEPETVQKQIRVTDSKLYAGSAVFLASPPPSSLPVPAFFSKKNRDDKASSDLRRLLRLDLVWSYQLVRPLQLGVRFFLVTGIACFLSKSLPLFFQEEGWVRSKWSHGNEVIMFGILLCTP